MEKTMTIYQIEEEAKKIGYTMKSERYEHWDGIPTLVNKDENIKICLIPMPINIPLPSIRI